MAEGGVIPAKPASFFEGITLLDVGMITLISVAMFYSIYASRQTIAFIRSRQHQAAAAPSSPATS